MRCLWLGVVCAAACGDAVRLQTAPPWPSDHTAVVLAVSPSGVAQSAGLTILEPGERADITLAAADRGGWLVAQSWPPPPLGPDLTSCTVTLGEGGDALPPGTWWRTAPVEEDAPIVWRTTDEKVGLVVRCDVVDRMCEGVDVQPLDIGPTRGSLWAVQWVDDGVILGGQADMDMGNTELFAVSAEGRVSTLWSPELEGKVRGLGRLGSDVYGATSHGQVFVTRESGAVEVLAQLETTVHVWVQPPDLVLVQQTATVTPTFVEIDPRSGGVRPRLDIPTRIRVGAVVSRALVYLAATDGRIFRGDGAQWIEEYASAADPEYTAAAATASVAFVAPRYTGVLMRRPDGLWIDIGRPPALAFPNDLAVLSRERALMIATGGGVGLWDGRRWCRVVVPTRLDLASLSVEADGRTVWIVGRNAARGEPPAVLRLVVPP